MKISSSAFEEDGKIPEKYTCDGEDINPPIQITDYPSNTKCFVLIVEDPDAPAGNWIHWILFNIPINKAEIAENESVEGAVEGMTDFGKSGWGGPCPPSGSHRYYFRAYALDKTLDLQEGASKEQIEQEMQGHILDSAAITASFSRKS